MTNIERLKYETTGITLQDDLYNLDEQYCIYLKEAGVIDPHAEYNPLSNLNKKQIYQAALSVLESVANNPALMKSYKEDDISVSGIADSLQSRIQQLEYKLRMLPNEGTSDDNKNNRTFFLFQS